MIISDKLYGQFVTLNFVMNSRFSSVIILHIVHAYKNIWMYKGKSKEIKGANGQEERKFALR